VEEYEVHGPGDDRPDSINSDTWQLPHEVARKQAVHASIQSLKKTKDTINKNKSSTVSPADSGKFIPKCVLFLCATVCPCVTPRYPLMKAAARVRCRFAITEQSPGLRIGSKTQSSTSSRNTTIYEGADFFLSLFSACFTADKRYR
jgi:hypothetical protein